MTRLPELLENAVGPVQVDFGVDEIETRVKRRRRRRAFGVASAVAIVVLFGAVVAGAVTGGRKTAPELRVGPTVPAPASDVLVFDDAGGILTVDLNARTAIHRPIQGWRPGDQPFLSLRVGNDFVVGWDSVYAAPLDSERSRRLGTGVFVPAAEPGDVWLTSYGQVQTQTDRLVDMQGHVILQARTPKEVALTGIPGGLVLQSDTGLDIWDAHTDRITRHLGTMAGQAAAAHGSLLAWCDRCNRTLELTDLKSGTTRSFDLVPDGGSLSLGRITFSPDGTRLAVPVVPDGAAGPGATTKVIVVNVPSDAVSSPIDTHERYASIAWSPDGRRLYVAATNDSGGGELLVYDVAAKTTRDLGRLPRGAGDISDVMTRSDQERMPVPAAGSAGDCQPLGPANAPDANAKLCRFAF